MIHDRSMVSQPSTQVRSRHVCTFTIISTHLDFLILVLALWAEVFVVGHGLIRDGDNEARDTEEKTFPSQVEAFFRDLNSTIYYRTQFGESEVFVYLV